LVRHQPIMAHKERNKKKQSTTKTMIDAPDPFDVLFGRGKPIQKHPGNKLLRLLIDQNCHRYNKAPRLERRAIANEIVQGIKSNNGKLPGRFLRPRESEDQEEEHGWEEATDKVAIDKVSHCFRARRSLAPEKASSGTDSLETRRTIEGTTSTEAEDSTPPD
jgi:hypothetical protein